jgi:hypothetical protein
MMVIGTAAVTRRWGLWGLRGEERDLREMMRSGGFVVPQTRARARAILAAVSSADGIDRSEARMIAGAYFMLDVSGCGFAGEPERDGDSWTSVAHVGYGGQPDPEPIRIDARTGGVRGPGAHEFATLEAFRAAIAP